MNDAERDAWLREALRHAPDSGALPPRDVSEAILAAARATARQGQTARPGATRAARRHPLATLWDWLGRPPVAAGLASVVAATLVGLMWWDQPMDETSPRRPDAVGERAKTTSAGDAVAPAPVRAASPLAKNEPSNGTVADAAPAAAESRAPAGEALADAPTPRRQLREARDDAATARAKAAPQAADEKRKVTDALAKESTARGEQKAAKPSPFPTLADGEHAPPAVPPVAARKDNAAEVAQAADAAAPSGAAAADRGLDAAKTAPAAAPASPQSAAPAVRGGALADARERQASVFAGQSTAQAHNELAAAPPSDGGPTAAPLAPILGAFASEPARWSRAAADGRVVALETGWREWLTQLDAIAGGRWHRVDLAGAAAADRGGATTLRLLAAGSPEVVVRLDGTTAHFDGGARGGRWQATLPAAAAERLRRAAEHLPR